MQNSQIYYHSLGGLFSVLPPNLALFVTGCIVFGILAVLIFYARVLHRTLSAAVVRRFVERLTAAEMGEIRVQLAALQAVLWCGALICIIAGSDASVHECWASIIFTLLAYACFSGARIAKDCRRRMISR